MKHYLLVTLLTIPLLWNLLRPGFYTSHDGEWMAIRLTAIHQELRRGQIPVRWTWRLNQGRGYPVTNFLYPLPFYLAEPTYILTGRPDTAIQAVMAVSVVSLALSTFALLRLLGLWPALAGTAVVVYSPYLAFNLYQRGSLGEITAMGIVPWIFWAARAKNIPLTSILTAALITAHNVVAALFILPVLLYSAKSFKTFKITIIVFLLALGAAASFWIPALAELRYVRASQISVSDFNAEYLPLTASLQLTGPVVAAASGGLPLYLTSAASSWVWNTLPSLKIIQFPWRTLSLFSFAAAAIAGLAVSRLSSNKLQITTAIILITLSAASAVKFTTPERFVSRPPSYYATNDDTTTSRAEYTPLSTYPGLKQIAGRQVWSETPLRTASNLISLASVLTILAWFQRSYKPQTVQ